MGMFKSILPGIVADGPNSEIVMNRCEIKGNKDKDTSIYFFLYNLSVGIMIKKADAIIKDCKIHNLRLGGIHLWAEEDNRVKILNNKVEIILLYYRYNIITTVSFALVLIRKTLSKGIR